MKAETKYDVIIVGGGMVGASLALALKDLPLKIALIDAFNFKAKQQPSYDDRSVALSYGSRLIYEKIGLWKLLSQHVNPIKKIHISERGRFGATRLNAIEANVSALGYLIENRVLGQCLYQQLKNSCIEQIIPATVGEIENKEAQVNLTLIQKNEQQSLSTRLLVAADGTNSFIRQKIGLAVTQTDYQQVAIITNVSTSKFHNHQAFERFTPSGPIALLPLSNNRCSLVWTHKNKAAKNMLQLDDKAFLQQLQQAFGYRLGTFTKTGKRASYPLSLLKSKQEIKHRTILIGNASHTLHPVAGQGLNLALRDIAVLTHLLSTPNNNIKSLLQQYENQRKNDINTTVFYTDTLVKLFSNNCLPLSYLRASGLIVVDRIKLLKNWLIQQSIGMKYENQ